MTRLKEASDSSGQPPEELLWRALRADSPDGRLRYATEGLSRGEDGLDPDTHVLLLRQLYLAHLELRQLRRACDIARQMAEVGPLEDIGHHDTARVLAALGELDEAIAAQRLAARAAPADRRSFQLWSLAVLQHHAGRHDAARTTLDRARRWSGSDRPLLDAYAAYVELDRGTIPDGLDEVVAALHGSKCREGYGRFLLGMIAHHMGDTRGASVHLRAFLNRNAAVDGPKELSLREELRRARLALASIESA